MYVMQRTVKKGATSQIMEVLIRHATTGSGLTGLVYNTDGLAASYSRAGAARVAISLVTQTVTGAFSSGGFVEIDATNMPGVYRLDVPNAALASGVDEVVIYLHGAASMEASVIICELDTNTSADIATLLGTPAGASVSADIASAYARLGVPAGASMSADIAAVKAETNSILTDTATIGTPAGASVSADIAAIKAETNSILTDTATIGSPAGASVSADIAAIKAETALIVDDTGTSGVKVVTAVGVKKNTQLAGFMFDMIDSTTKRPATGKTITATRSIDGAAFASCANSASEVANGTYKITLAAADLNGNNVMLRFTATGCEDTKVHIVTQVL